MLRGCDLFDLTLRATSLKRLSPFKDSLPIERSAWDGDRGVETVAPSLATIFALKELPKVCLPSALTPVKPGLPIASLCIV